MASPRTRRILQDLRPTNENTVSKQKTMQPIGSENMNFSDRI